LEEACFAGAVLAAVFAEPLGAAGLELGFASGFLAGLGAAAFAAFLAASAQLAGELGARGHAELAIDRLQLR
jgi:hypothetical protein